MVHVLKCFHQDQSLRHANLCKWVYYHAVALQMWSETNYRYSRHVSDTEI